jgi:CubicO group peptidase (beta-lactamase class C family)
MKYSGQENKLIDKIKQAIPDVTPGVSARAYHMGRMVCDINVGNTYPYYDLASLTKVIFTQQAIMEAFDRGLWSLETKVKDILPDFNHDILIKELLTHTSGLEWWLALYEQIQLDLSWQEKRSWIYKQVNNSKLNKTGKSVYSDLGIILLGFILEKIYEKDIYQIWLEIKDKYYPTTTLDFHLDNKTEVPREHFAPTEDCKWRKRIMRSEVHDENTWSFGGISTHSGLFGSIEDVSAYGLNVRSQLQGIARYSVRQKTAQLFATRAIPTEVGDWALGFMMPSPETASCGPHFSVLSIGHTGFTGTSFWYDPRNDLLVLILSNRVHYGRDNRAFVSLRPQIHSWIFESLRRTN